MPKPKIAPKPVVAKPKPAATLPPKGAPKQKVPKPTIVIPFYKDVVEDSKYTIIPPNLPSAMTTRYRPEPDPYPFYTVPNGQNAQIGKQGTSKKIQKNRAVHRRGNL